MSVCWFSVLSWEKKLQWSFAQEMLERGLAATASSLARMLLMWTLLAEGALTDTS